MVTRIVFEVEGDPHANERAVESYVNRFPERRQVYRPDISCLTIAEAAGVLADFCFEQPDFIDGDIALKTTGGGTVVAVEQTQAPGVEAEEEPWVSRIRLAEHNRNPFEVAGGLEIVLPHGVNSDCDPEDMKNAFGNWYRFQHTGVYVSYPMDGMRWNSVPIQKILPVNGWRINPSSPDPQEPLDPLTDTVKTLDDCIARGRPGSPDEWIGYLLSTALAEIE